MKNNKLKLANTLAHRYSKLVAEIVAQRDLFPSNKDYTATLVKYQQRLNMIQGIILRAIV